MKKIGKNSKKGFTLVELIVVLVILAIMAAMLVPALTGYIRKARAEKDYQAASQALVAAQSLVTEYYGTNTSASTAGAVAAVTMDDVNELLGGEILEDEPTVTVSDDYQILTAEFAINGSVYTYDFATNAWTAETN